MRVPQAIIGLRVYKKGQKVPLGAVSVELPSLEPITSSIKGAGIAGEFNSPVKGQFGSMTVKLNWRIVDDQSLLLASSDDVSLQCFGAPQILNSETGKLEVHSFYVSIRGYIKKNDLGKLEAGSTSDPTTEIEVNYLKVEMDDKRYIEIDKLNFVAFHNGKDVLADVRKALGM